MRNTTPATDQQRKVSSLNSLLQGCEFYIKPQHPKKLETSALSLTVPFICVIRIPRSKLFGTWNFTSLFFPATRSKLPILKKSLQHLIQEYLEDERRDVK